MMARVTVRSTDRQGRIEDARMEGPMKKMVLATVVALGMLIGFDGLADAQSVGSLYGGCPMSTGPGFQAPANPYQAPMDMSWAIRSQTALQYCGDRAAMNAAAAYYYQMQRLRAMGYTGPSLPTGVTNQSLQNSINALNAQYQRNNQSAMHNSDVTSRAVGDWDLRAIRGCVWTYDNYGHPYYLCP